MLDSRDLIKELEDLRDDEERDEDEQERLDELEKLNEEGEGTFEDWNSGVTLIPEDDFEDYAREFASDIGAIDSNAPWPLDCIDWDKAADALKEDYSEIEWEGVTYLGR